MSNFNVRLAGSGAETAVIGIGDVGCEIVGSIRFLQSQRPLLIRVNWEDSLPKLTDEFIHIALDIQDRGFRGDPICAAKSTANLAPELVELTLSSSVVVMVAQPGDGVGSGATTALADAFKRAKVPFLVLLLLPDADTVGRKRHLTARGTISELCVMKEYPVIFDQADFPGYYQAFKKSVRDKIQILMDALSPGMIPIDFNRVRHALTGPGGSAVAMARATGARRAQDVAESVLADFSIEPFLHKKASILLHFQSDDALSLYEVEEAAHLITGNWGADVDLIYGIGQGGCNPGELRIGLVVGEYADVTEAEEADVMDTAESLLSGVLPGLHSGSAW